MGRQIGGLYVLLLVMNAGAWTAALLLFRGQPVQLGAAMLAYGLGLRHAVDADHIAAIDSATRKLMVQGRRSADVGLFFSLGHSSIVILLSLLLATAASAIQTHLPAFASVGAAIGTMVSVVVLFGLAVVNLVVLSGVWHTFRQVRAGVRYEEAELDTLVGMRGIPGRVFRGLFALIGRSWHMYLIGLLFGLGFDTATEIGVLGLSAASGAHHLGIWSIMVYPALFTAAMSLVDTTDSVLMTRAYGWALADPARKLAYNLVVTALSAATALVVGGIEAAALLRTHLDLGKAYGRAIDLAADHLGDTGCAIVAAFVACWLGSVTLARVRTREGVALRA